MASMPSELMDAEKEAKVAFHMFPYPELQNSLSTTKFHQDGTLGEQELTVTVPNRELLLLSPPYLPFARPALGFEASHS